MRRSLDDRFCRSGRGVRKLGSTCAWAVVESRIRPGAAILSGGAGRDISFELELAERHGCQVALFDPSPTGRETMAALPSCPEGLRFFALGLAGQSSHQSFGPPADTTEGSFRIVDSRPAVNGGIEFECLGPRDCLRQAGMHHLELLKLDIEGFEYGFISAMLASGIRPIQIAVEFHHFLPGISLMKTLTAIRQLRNAGYRILHKDQCDYLFVHQDWLGK
jgi:Methyltransferase FkbM domain